MCNESSDHTAQDVPRDEIEAAFRSQGKEIADSLFNVFAAGYRAAHLVRERNGVKGGEYCHCLGIITGDEVFCRKDTGWTCTKDEKHKSTVYILTPKELRELIAAEKGKTS